MLARRCVGNTLQSCLWVAQRVGSILPTADATLRHVKREPHVKLQKKKKITGSLCHPCTIVPGTNMIDLAQMVRKHAIRICKRCDGGRGDASSSCRGLSGIEAEKNTDSVGSRPTNNAVQEHMRFRKTIGRVEGRTLPPFPLSLLCLSLLITVSPAVRMALTLHCCLYDTSLNVSSRFDELEVDLSVSA